MRTLVFIRTAVHISDADFRLHTPMTGEQPLIAVGYTCPQHPSLETMVLQLAEIGA